MKFSGKKKRNKNTKCPIDAHCHRHCRKDLRILQGLYRILGVSEESWIKPENLRFPRTGMISSVGQKSNHNIYREGERKDGPFKKKALCAHCPQAPRIHREFYAILNEPKIPPAMAMVMSIHRTLSVLVLSEIVVTEIRN